MADYGKIDQPYNALMNRSLTGTGPAEFDSEYQGYEGDQSASGTINDRPVENGKQMGDLWISSFIRSTNWKPGVRGFNIDGRTGNAEFNNVTVRGTIESSIIRGSTLSGMTITAGTVGQNYITIDGDDATYTAYTGGVRRILITTSSMSFYDSTGTLGATITASGSGLLVTASGGELQVLGDLVVGGGDFLPSLSLGVNIGSSSLRFGAGYFQSLDVGSGNITPSVTNTVDIGGSSLRFRNGYFANIGLLNSAPGNYAALTGGSGSPEGAITATVGTLWLRTDGGAGTTLYIKESGSGNTGWVAK